MVIRDAPVEPLFEPQAALILTTSTEKPHVKLPACTPLVSSTRRLPMMPPAHRHRNDVSDSQLVRSHPVAPNSDDIENVTRPMLAPCNVTLIDPDAA